MSPGWKRSPGMLFLWDAPQSLHLTRSSASTIRALPQSMHIRTPVPIFGSLDPPRSIPSFMGIRIEQGTIKINREKLRRSGSIPRAPSGQPHIRMDDSSMLVRTIHFRGGFPGAAAGAPRLP
ncbi:hypothetical protein CENSYa_0441 [Cenarchaeum symbiosum A]|uniref:Uncharacterized protein n=1 Tax=Cenarchaeum symbiosum (strain A) TaxID=414004 RepID=A0RUQ9_CENSY|nr:hypothetical protein CENSYa_0441 [Cenarchaeum symbiosum A]